MTNAAQDIQMKVAGTARRCPIGESVGRRGMEQSRIPVLSCEGACIRGEIARQAANMVAREAPYGRACHGELLTAPGSSIARWVRTAGKVVLIDGCFMRCHGRILEGMLDAGRLVQFDALAVHKKYCDVFDADDVPAGERLAAARQVADHVLASLEEARKAATSAGSRAVRPARATGPFRQRGPLAEAEPGPRGKLSY